MVAENTLLAYSAKSVDMIDFEKTECSYPKLNTFDRSKDTLPPAQYYDIICSYSSIEHCGLGRYGDKIDPHGDLFTMKEIHDWLVEDGIAMVAVPVASRSILHGIGHRLFGKDY